MNRLALKRLLSGLVIAALPVPTTGCPGGCSEPVAQNVFVPLPPGGIQRNGAAAPINTPLTEAECTRACGWGADAGLNAVNNFAADLPHECRITTGGDGGELVYCQYFTQSFCVGGRKPAGLHAGESGATSRSPTLGAWFARMAHLEAASIPAFRRLYRELKAAGAPSSLLAAARVAIADEQRHARTMKGLARRFGAEVPEVVIEEVADRTLVEVAIENAVEGCVAETWGALLAGYQARAATDRAVARAFARVADEEAEHAELSWAIDRWVRRRLTSEELERLERAHAEAVARLAHAVEQDGEVPGEIRGTAGFPDRAARATLFDGLRRTLWS